MRRLLRLALKGPGIIMGRLRSQGIGTTLLWVYARGIPAITGVPLIKYSQITPQVYVGPQFRAAGKRKLERLGINNSVNLRAEFDDKAKGLDMAGYCHLPVVDDESPTLEQLDEGVTFIKSAVENGGKVYIHCAGGVGRAPTMAVAYFINQGISFDDAEKLVKSARRFIKLMPPQIEQLKRYEAVQSQRVKQRELD